MKKKKKKHVKVSFILKSKKKAFLVLRLGEINWKEN